jgi:predicted AlkP superfamily phosphohydrolase/phosphomutase
MKLLTLGIDGGDRRIIDAMPMPYLRKLLQESFHVPVVEDLWGRGWAKILSGKSGHDTGAFYTKPVPLASGCKASQTYRSEDYSAAGVQPLWEKINSRGLRVGFMNVPTTYPAPIVDGFMVSGAGGGFGGKGSIREGVSYPREVVAILEEEEYLFDTRYVASGIRERHTFLARLKSMTERRVRTFLRLADAYQIHVGFIAFMGLQRIQYLAMAEIEKMIGIPDNHWTADQSEIAALYSHFDEQFHLLVGEVNPQNIVVVSDHGQAPYKYAADVGAFLRAQDWQVNLQRGVKPIRRGFRSLLKKYVPRKILLNFAHSAPKLRDIIAHCSIDFRNSRAFGMRYVSGIYVNDSRFGGPARGDLEDFVQEIVERFNSYHTTREFSMSARPYRREHMSAKFEELLPDIWIDSPDSIFFEHGLGESYSSDGRMIQENKAYYSRLDWSRIDRDQWTGIKGRNPLLAVKCSTPAISMDDLSSELTAAFEVIMRICAL